MQRSKTRSDHRGRGTERRPFRHLMAKESARRRTQCVRLPTMLGLSSRTRFCLRRRTARPNEYKNTSSHLNESAKLRSTFECKVSSELQWFDSEPPRRLSGGGLSPRAGKLGVNFDYRKSSNLRFFPPLLAEEFVTPSRAAMHFR